MQTFTRKTTYLVRSLLLLVLLGMCVGVAVAGSSPRVLFINSYHAGYEWSDGVQRGVESVLASKPVELHHFYMDTKRQRAPEQIAASAQRAVEEIERLKPDLVITADDNAVKHVLSAHFRDARLPFVFCGVNWDASVYGLPYSNATGMVEVSLIRSLVDNLTEVARGSRIGVLSIDALSNRQNVLYFERELERSFDEVRFVASFQEWKDQFLELQQQVDLLVLESPEGISGWDEKQGRLFVEQNARIPIGSTHVWMAPLATMTIGKIPEEQGEWAAETALAMLAGTPVSSIPITHNRRGRLLLNLRLSQPLGIVFKPALIRNAEILR